MAEEDENYAIQFRTCDKINILLEIMWWKRHAISHKFFMFLSIAFIDSIIVDKFAAVRHIFECGYPLRREVKGLSHAVVKRITASTATHAPDDSSASLPSSAILVPRSLWQGKENAAVVKAMRDRKDKDYVIAYVLYNWCGLKNKTAIGQLLRGHAERIQENSTYAKHANACLKEAAAYRIESS